MSIEFPMLPALATPFRPVCLWNWSTVCYQPPGSSHEADLWSAVHLRCLAAVRHVAKKILGSGLDQGDLLRNGSYVVALRRAYLSEAGQILSRGAWVCLSTGAYGESLVELYTHVHHCSYRDAILTLASEAKLADTTSDLAADNRIRNWCQEQHPLHYDLMANCLPLHYPLHSELHLYCNRFRQATIQAICWKGAEGETVRVYRSRWRHRRDSQSQWAEILPQSPLPLLHLDLLQHQPTRPAILVHDESLAAELSQRHTEVLFSTTPGGLKNLPFADLEALQGRPVRVVMGRGDLEQGYRVEHALRKAGVGDACFSVNFHEPPRPFEALKAVAADLQIALLPPPASRKLAQGFAVVSAAGQPIPGADEVRLMLIDPIIRTGSITWLYAETKIGKTWLALAVAHAAARGNSRVGRWRTSKPIGVLHVDGEMFPDDLQQAISMVMTGAGDPPGPPPFAVICAQNLDRVLDVTSETWQQEIETHLHNVQLLIFDNFQSVTDNGPTALNMVRPWLRRLSKMGIAVLVIDHTNREGEVQGGMAKERVVNLSIALRYPDDRAKAEERFLVEYPVARRLYGASAEPFQLRKCFTDNSLVFEEVEPEAGVHRAVRPQVLTIALVAFAKEEEGLSYPKILGKYGIAQSTAHGYYREASKLTGDEKAAYDKERQRLLIERSSSSST